MGTFPAGSGVGWRGRDTKWHTPVPVDRRGGRPESAGLNLELLAALVLCLDFWVLLALTVNRLT